MPFTDSVHTVIIRFKRPEYSVSNPAQIQDAATCKAWLSGMAQPDSQESLEHIADVAQSLVDGSLAPDRKLEILDRIRVVLYDALRERVRDGEFRATPLTSTESAPLWTLLDTTEAVRTAYLRLAGGAVAKNVQVAALHHALDLHAHGLMLVMRCRVSVPDVSWERLCNMGQRVRELECQDIGLEDPVRASLTETCRAAFVFPILLALADPARLTFPEFLAVQAGARRWGRKVGFRIGDDAADRSVTARPAVAPGPSVRLGPLWVRFDTLSLQKSLAQRLVQLAAGHAPEKLGLGDAIAADAAVQLLRRLERLWGPWTVQSIDSPDIEWQAPQDEKVAALVGPLSSREQKAAAGSTGKKQAAPTYRYIQERYDRLTRSHTEIEQSRREALMADAENWIVAGVAGGWVRCLRRNPRPRLGLNQLIGLKFGGKGSTQPLRLGLIRGLQQETLKLGDHVVARPADAHRVDVELLEGTPVAVRAAVDGKEYDTLFVLLPDALAAGGGDSLWDMVRAGSDVCSLITPVGLCRSGRELRALAHGVAVNLRCTELIRRGPDFDQTGFSLI